MSLIDINKIAAMSVQYFHYSLDYYLKSMQENGIKNIDLWGASPHYCRLDYNTRGEAERAIKELKSKIDDIGARVEVYTPETLSYPYSLSSPSLRLRDRTVDYFEMAMQDAKAMGCDKVFINSGCSPLDIPREDGWKRAIKTVKRICKRAEDYGIMMVLEQLQPYESNLVTTLQDVKRMIDEVDNPSLNVCIDVVAMAVANESITSYFEVLGKDKIKLIHFADTCHYILGDGELPLKQYVKELEANGYVGIIDLEINDSIYWDDPNGSIAKSLKYINM